MSGERDVGGMVGKMNVGEIRESYAVSEVSGSFIGVGGMVGEMNGGEIRESYAVSEVSGYRYVGGMVGVMYYGEIRESYAVSEVEWVVYRSRRNGRNNGMEEK